MVKKTIEYDVSSKSKSGNFEYLQNSRNEVLYKAILDDAGMVKKGVFLVPTLKSSFQFVIIIVESVIAIALLISFLFTLSNFLQADGLFGFFELWESTLIRFWNGIWPLVIVGAVIGLLARTIIPLLIGLAPPKTQIEIIKNLIKRPEEK